MAGTTTSCVCETFLTLLLGRRMDLSEVCDVSDGKITTPIVEECGRITTCAPTSIPGPPGPPLQAAIRTGIHSLSMEYDIATFQSSINALIGQRHMNTAEKLSQTLSASTAEMNRILLGRYLVVLVSGSV